MCSCHSILECCVMFSGVKLSIRSFVLLQPKEQQTSENLIVKDNHFIIEIGSLSKLTWRPRGGGQHANFYSEELKAK